jgi:Tfp pilus assembly protein PilF
LALTNINRAIELGSKNPQLFKIRANIYEDAGQIKAAIADYEQLLTLEPTNESIKQRIQLLKN